MPEPLRIVHVALQLETGGMERLLVEFARVADRTRFDLRFVALGTRGSVAREIESCGWPVTALDMCPGVRPAVIYRLAMLFRTLNVDIVHTHNTKPLLYAGPAARLVGARGVVHTRHGQRYGSGSRQDTLFRWACRCADRVVCVSDDSARLCRAEGLNASTVSTITNGIDTERFVCARPVQDGPAIFVGRLAREKDVATLLRASALVLRRRPSFRLKIAGDGPCAAELTKLSTSLGLDGCVSFLREVRDVPALLRQASVFVLPSLTEGLPLTVLEAMASGLPVVATRVGGTPEAVADRHSGLLVEPGQADQLADALLRLTENIDLARSMGQVGARRARDLFDARRMVARYESLYKEVRQRRRALTA